MQKKIRYWASQNVATARILLVLIHTFLGVLAFHTAFVVRGDFNFLPYLVPVPLLIGLYILLENKHRRQVKNSLHYTMVGLRMFFWFFVGLQANHYFFDEVNVSTSQRSASAQLVAYKVEEKNISQNDKMYNISPKKIFLSFYKEKIKRLKKWIYEDETSALEIILWILLGLIIIALVTYFGYLLSCSLSCAGSEMAALLVLILGIAIDIGTIYMTVIKIIEVLERKTKEAKQKKKVQKKPVPVPAPSKPVIPKQEDPPPPKDPVEELKRKGLSRKERKELEREVKVDKGIVVAKILTVIFLVGLFYFAITS